GATAVPECQTTAAVDRESARSRPNCPNYMSDEQLLLACRGRIIGKLHADELSSILLLPDQEAFVQRKRLRKRVVDADGQDDAWRRHCWRTRPCRIECSMVGMRSRMIASSYWPDVGFVKSGTCDSGTR